VDHRATARQEGIGELSTTDATTAAGTIRSLTIRRIETIPIRVPLGRI
jgi:hypothetical protein